MRRRLRVVDDADACYPFRNRQLEVEQLTHGARQSREEERTALVHALLAYRYVAPKCKNTE